jgi:hypothetical protein
MTPEEWQARMKSMLDDYDASRNVQHLENW